MGAEATSVGVCVFVNSCEHTILNEFCRELKSRDEAVGWFHRAGAEQWQYKARLAALAGVQPEPPVIRRIYERVVESVRADVRNYKRFNYRIVDDEDFHVELPDEIQQNND